MNLHGIVSPYIGAVNPLIPVSLRVSIGTGPTQDNGERTPLYAAPGGFTGSIAGTVLTITAIASGQPQAGQTLAGDTLALLEHTLITGQLTGDPGGVGTYSINREQTVASQAISTTAILLAEVQPMSWKDLAQLDGINLGGERRKIYLHGEVDGVIRVSVKGGDLITIDAGVNKGVWLIAQTLEQFPDWVSAAMTLQNEDVE